MIPKRTLSQEEKTYFLSLKPEDITLDLLQDLFANRFDNDTKKVIPSKYNTYDEFSLKKGEYFNKEDIVTNCGLFIWNKFIIEKSFQEIVGYCNKPLTKKELGRIASILDAALLEDDITPTQYIDDYLNKKTWLEFSFNTEITTSLTIRSMKELPSVAKRKKELMKELHDELTSDDNNKVVVAADKMVKDLLTVAEDELKDDPAMDLYKSGARGAFDNAYKNSQIMKGTVYNSAKHEFDVVYNSLIKGISKENIPDMSNSMIDATYSKSIASGECGYITKKLNAAFQSSVLDKRGSDCHSKGYDVISLNDSNYTLYSYNFIIEGDKLVRLDSKSKAKYMGKTVKMRSNAYCTNPHKTCNMCAGDKMYLIDKINYGLTVSKMSNALLNKRMKQMHESNVKLYTIDAEKDFL